MTVLNPSSADDGRRRSSIIRELSHLRENPRRDNPQKKVMIGFGVGLLGLAGILMVANQVFDGEQNSQEGSDLEFIIPKLSNAEAIDQATLCPKFPSVELKPVEYDYFDFNFPALMHMKYTGQITKRMSAYDDHFGHENGNRTKRQEKDKRIIGGEIASIKSFPFFVSLYSYSSHQHMCGGSIISKKWVLTAAHCIDALPHPKFWAVHGGISTNTQIEEKHYDWEHITDVLAIVMHPNWDQNSFQNDIAIMKMKTPIFAYTDYLQPHCLPFPSSKTPSHNPGQQVTIVGFGYTDENGNSPSTILREVTLSMFRNSDCNRMFGANWVTDEMICAGNIKGGKDACQGDSGGPLSVMTHENGEPLWWLMGAVSFGVGCGRKELGGVYTNVKIYTDWIAASTAHYDSEHL